MKFITFSFLVLILITVANCVTPPEEGQKEAVESLKKKSDVNSRVKDEQMPLHIAVSVGQTEAVESLKKKADVNSRVKDEQMPLHLAARRDQTEVAKLLGSWPK